MNNTRTGIWNQGVYLFLVIPVIIACLAYHGFGFVYKAGVPLSCALIILYFFAHIGYLGSCWPPCWSIF
jgi:hypothetical protein